MLGKLIGQHYYFLARDEFQDLVARGELLEWAEFAGNCYGTPRQPIQEQVDQGRLVILEIELEGARQVRESFPEAQQIFVLPPSLEELESRIRARGQDEEAAIQKRLAKASIEIDAAGEFDIQIVNDDLGGSCTTAPRQPYLALDRWRNLTHWLEQLLRLGLASLIMRRKSIL